MKILISHLPKHKWWGHGTPIYKDNPAMKQGMIPNQELVEVEMHMLTQLFNRLPVEVIEVDFRDVYPFGGGLHCSTTDVYREGKCEDYFPKQ